MAVLRINANKLALDDIDSITTATVAVEYFNDNVFQITTILPYPHTYTTELHFYVHEDDTTLTVDYDILIDCETGGAGHTAEATITSYLDSVAPGNIIDQTGISVSDGDDDDLSDSISESIDISALSGWHKIVLVGEVAQSGGQADAEARNWMLYKTQRGSVQEAAD